MAGDLVNFKELNKSKPFVWSIGKKWYRSNLLQVDKQHAKRE